MRFEIATPPPFLIFGLLAAVLACGSTASVPSSEAGGEIERIAEVLELRPGLQVADVGAGDGEWSVGLARVVGESGHVYATEVDEDDLDDIRELVADEKLDHVTTILGDDLETGLPEGCCDAVLLRLVYHHFTDPAAMRASLRQALRPGGLIAVIDFDPKEHWSELDGVPDRGGHGILADDLVADMTGDGFEVVGRFDAWDPEEPEHYCVVFRRLAGGPTG